MRNKLIKLAKEKGFSSRIYLAYNTIDFLDKQQVKEFNNLKFYLWMCELQKWIIDECNIYLGIVYSIEHRKWVTIIGIDLYEVDKIIYYSSYEKALEKGLIDILNKLTYYGKNKNKTLSN